ncbi:MAG: hypothetical protein DMD74_06585 [Gemmatimonadetes bacterium]|nr:MAG: hypothetical protein DMD74_06585 [Gemmatimonadota bacterium]
MRYAGLTLSTLTVVSLVVSTAALSQGLRVGLLGGTTDLTAGGWSVAGLTFSETGPYAIGTQVGNKGAGAMVELQWRNDRNGTLGGGGSNLYSPHTGLAGRILVGWVF